MVIYLEQDNNRIDLNEGLVGLENEFATQGRWWGGVQGCAGKTNFKWARLFSTPPAHPCKFLLGGRLIYKLFYTKNKCFLLIYNIILFNYRFNFKPAHTESKCFTLKIFHTFKYDIHTLFCIEYMYIWQILSVKHITKEQLSMIYN